MTTQLEDTTNMIDKNPQIDCADCNQAYRWQDYWKPRVEEGDRVEDPRSSEPWRCDECHRQHRRGNKNQKLAGFD